MQPEPFFSILVAMDRNRAIGNNGDLPWHQRADLQRFKRITMGRPILMGRKTHDAIGRVLPGRHNIVLTRDENYQPTEGCTVVNDLDVALLMADSPEIMIIGGADIFAATLPRAQKIYLTEIDAEVEADTFFPALDENQWQELTREHHPADEQNDYPCSFIDLVRIS